MGVIRHKTWYDLWESKGRTVQVVLIIAIGAFAIGTTLGALELISQDITHVWRKANPPVIGLWSDPAIDSAMLDTLEDLEGIESVEGHLEEGIKWRLTPDDPWQTSTLIAREDYDEQTVSLLTLDSGAWPERKLFTVERGHGLEVGDQVHIEIEEKRYVVEIGGVVYNTMVAPAGFGGGPTLYTTRERFGQLTGEPNFNRIYATLPEYDPTTATQAADRIQAHLEKQDIEVGAALPEGTRTTNPDTHFIQEDLNGIFFILTTMAALSLILGLFLVYNTITAIISQQIPQIGMMKAIGASFWQVLGVFFSQVFIYACLALLLTIPLGALGAQQLRVLLVGMFNMTPGPLVLLPQVIAVQAVVALLAPIVVAIIPILIGARLTVREAINTYGLGGTASLIDRLLARAKAFPRTLALTIGNTFRNRGRVILTQITLIGSGLIFMMVMNAQTSLQHTFGETLFSIFEANVFLNFEDQQRIKNMEALALSHPAVTGVEMWSFGNGTLRPADRPASNDDLSADVRGIPVPTKTYKPDLRQGRWLQPNDSYAVVLHQDLAKRIGVEVGDWVILDIPLKRESRWQVVGVTFSPFNEDAANVPRETLLKELHEVGLASHIRIKTVQDDAASEATYAAQLRDIYERNGYPVRPSNQDTAHQITDNIMNGGIAIVINLLAGMSIVIAIVGGVTLSGVLSINVMERRREIGVMRAIGASSLHLMQIFIGEGLMLAWLSWLIAWPLSLPAGRLMAAALESIMETDLTYSVSILGAFYWLAIITLLAIIASWFPARSASRVSVRESLAYQ